MIEITVLPPMGHQYCPECGRGYHEPRNGECRCMFTRVVSMNVQAALDDKYDNGPDNGQDNGPQRL
jgi:hypothetical protein